MNVLLLDFQVIGIGPSSLWHTSSKATLLQQSFLLIVPLLMGTIFLQTTTQNNQQRISSKVRMNYTWVEWSLSSHISITFQMYQSGESYAWELLSKTFFSCSSILQFRENGIALVVSWIYYNGISFSLDLGKHEIRIFIVVFLLLTAKLNIFPLQVVS